MDIAVNEYTLSFLLYGKLPVILDTAAGCESHLN